MSRGSWHMLQEVFCGYRFPTGALQASCLTCAAAAGLRRSPMDNSYSARMEEAHLVMFDVAEKAMSAAAVTPREVRSRSAHEHTLPYPGCMPEMHTSSAKRRACKPVPYWVNCGVESKPITHVDQLQSFSSEHGRAWHTQRTTSHRPQPRKSYAARAHRACCWGRWTF